MDKKMTVSDFLKSKGITPPPASPSGRQSISPDIHDQLDELIFRLFENGNTSESIRKILTRKFKKAKEKNDAM